MPNFGAPTPQISLNQASDLHKRLQTLPPAGLVRLGKTGILIALTAEHFFNPRNIGVHSSCKDQPA